MVPAIGGGCCAAIDAPPSTNQPTTARAVQCRGETSAESSSLGALITQLLACNASRNRMTRDACALVPAARDARCRTRDRLHSRLCRRDGTGCVSGAAMAMPSEIDATSPGTPEVRRLPDTTAKAGFWRPRSAVPSGVSTFFPLAWKNSAPGSLAAIAAFCASRRRENPRARRTVRRMVARQFHVTATGANQAAGGSDHSAASSQTAAGRAIDSRRQSRWQSNGPATAVPIDAGSR